MDFQQLKTDMAQPEYAGLSDADLLTALKQLTTATPHHINRITQRDIFTALGGNEGETVLKALESAAMINDVIARALPWTVPGVDHGIDICDPEVQGIFQSIVGGSVTQAMIDAIIDLQNDYVTKYPRLQMDDLNTARGLA